MMTNQRQSLLRRIFAKQEAGIIAATALLIAGLSLVNPAFISRANILSLMITFSFIGIIAVGEAMMIMAGDFDISVGSVAGMGAVISTTFMLRTNCFGLLETGGEWIGVLLCVIIAVLLCGLVGLLNAFLVVKVRLAPFLVTIATYFIARSIANVIAKGVPVYPLPKTVDWLGDLRLSIGGWNTGISWIFIFFLVLTVIFEFILRKTEFGRAIYATGSNKVVAQLSGINTDKIRFFCFIITSMFAGLSGFMTAAYMRMGYSMTGNMWELMVIASVVVGGVSVAGGKGSMIGMFAGVVLIHVLSTGLVMLGMNTYLSYVFQGAMNVAAVFFDQLLRAREIKGASTGPSFEQA